MSLGLKLRKPEVIKRIYEMHLKGFSYTSISEAIAEEFEMETTPKINTISNLIRTYTSRTSAAMEEDENLKGQLKNDYKDLITELRRFRETLVVLFEEERKTSNKLGIAKELREHLHLTAKLLGKLDKPDKVQINILDVTMKVVNILKDFEKEGYITINRLPEHFKE